MALTASRVLARGLIGLASLGVAGAAAAGDQGVAAVLGAGAGAIIGHSIGGPDAAVVGGIIGAAAGATVGASHRKIHYRGGHHGYAPPAYYPAPPRGPVYVMPPPAIVFVPSHGHGYWHHGFDDWGRPIRSWVPAPGHRRHYAPPRPYHHPYGPGYGHRW